MDAFFLLLAELAAAFFRIGAEYGTRMVAATLLVVLLLIGTPVLAGFLANCERTSPPLAAILFRSVEFVLVAGWLAFVLAWVFVAGKYEGERYSTRLLVGCG